MIQILSMMLFMGALCAAVATIAMTIRQNWIAILCALEGKPVVAPYAAIPAGRVKMRRARRIFANGPTRQQILRAAA